MDQLDRTTTRKDRSMLVKYLAPATLAGLVLSAVLAPTQVAAQAASASDSGFIQMAGSLGLLQAKLGKLAENKASSPAVKDFGKRMVADYAKLNEELEAGAKQAAYPSPVMLRQHQQTYDRFLRMGRDSFDKKYMAEMVADHTDAVRLYQQQAERGRIASLKELATKTLPTLQQQTALATETASSVGAEVTATADGEKQGS
jgi:putative membrane protein